MATRFSQVYNRFLGKITDDMYMELTPEETMRDLQIMLIDAIPGFEFPRQDLKQYELDLETIPRKELRDGDFVLGTIWNQIEDDCPCMDDESQYVIVDRSYFFEDLTSEEINILALLMLFNWVQRQVTSIENTRMKYSGSDFKMTSQANHLQKLLSLKSECHRESIHMQRLYKRRRITDEGLYRSNWDIFNTYDNPKIY